MELISIIVPVYNVEQYIKKCLDSIINQTYKNLEIILVDDGSKDTSGAICDEYAVRDNRINVIHRQNGGLSAARNTGLDIAKGDFIMFVDSDDFIDLDTVRYLHSLSMRFQSDISICSFTYCDTNGNTWPHDALTVPDGIVSKEDYWKYFYTDIRTFYVTMWAKLFRRSLWRKLRFPVGKLHEDEFVIHTLIDECERISVSKKPMYYYMQRSGSIINTTFKIQNLDAAEGMMQRCDFFIGKRDFNLAMTTLTTAMYSIVRIKNFTHEEFTVNRKRIKELHGQFRHVYKKLLFKKCSLYSKLKCGIFALGIKLFIKISGLPR